MSLSDIEIARRTQISPIEEIARKIDIPGEMLEHYGRYKSKISLDFYKQIEKNATGKLILVTAISPTPAGEGKTTTSIGLADALNLLGRKTTVCLREPSLGPCFGMKGGAAGGGYAQVVPMEDINLHFTGDIHAITMADNLLAAMLDNHLHHGNSLGIDVRRITWNRAIDLNDRALRKIVLGLGGTGNSIPREGGFDITVASEVMAIFCLSDSLAELKERLGRVVIANDREGNPVTAAQLKAHGAMAALLKEAIKPNLVQTLEGNPALVHGGPFANIAHGCSSIIATKLAMRTSEITVTEAGFGADLGAEKFFDIKCRKSDLKPDLAVLVATVRALKSHGGVHLNELSVPNPEALSRGMENMEKHIENLKKFGLPVLLAINAFPKDTEKEFEQVIERARELGVKAVVARHWAEGGKGAESLAQAALDIMETEPQKFRPLYPDELPLMEKIETICREIYGADGASADAKIMNRIGKYEEAGFGNLPVCIAKTQYSFSADPALKGRPRGFTIPIRDVKLSAGAGFLVVLAGEIMTMPGLPKIPAAESFDVTPEGELTGLF